ncbi:MAG: glycolate oxidase iron-sulfur subunit [Methylophaga sp.]|nr:MAG: glycolate oxidase iron-sulfur subunit [Methylophaga sp.]
MQTKIPEQIINTPQGKKADEILRSCVHCGFCLATCPTYQLSGNELDSPRGRIYLIKSALENNEVSQASLQYLDQCLTCRACETTCPSGVEYGQLIDIGRELVEPKRALWQKVYRKSVQLFLTSPKVFNAIGFFFRHSSITTPKIEAETINSRVLLLRGCVQPSLAPNINHVTKNVLAKLNIEAIETPQNECCGAVSHHLSAQQSALKQIKHNIDQWHPLLESGVESIISTASGCGVMVKDYYTLFESTDPYYQKAVAVSEKTQDIAEYLLSKDISALKVKTTNVSYHAPCTLQHGQKLPGVAEQLLSKLGYQLNAITDAHICCGSAGTYAIFQPEISKELRANKIKHLSACEPDVIVTSNIGCLMHLSKGTETPVQHWIELINFN